MLSTILSAFTVGEIRKKLAFTAAMLGVYRFGAHIPVPGINTQAVQPLITHFTAPRVFLIGLCLTAGCILVMWLGELITQRGIGNGSSLMIFASIVSRLPHGVNAWWTNDDQV